MALHTSIQVAIAGQMLPVVDSFTLNEAVGNHASFNIAIESEHLTSEEDANVNLLERSKSYLGEACTIQIEDTSDSGSSTMQFKGIITHLHGYRDSNDGVIREMVMITGMSSSILLEGGADTNSSLELSLSDIVFNTLGDFDQSLLNVTVAPDNDATLLYTVQQNQSKFSYLKHLAAQLGEYLLYAQDTLYFGKPDLGETVQLNLGVSLENISLGIKPIPTKFNYTTNDYLNETEVASATTAASGASGAGYISFASEVNDRLFTTENKIVLPTFEDSTLQQRADTSAELQKKILEQSQVQITGTSYLPSVSLGKLISVNNQDSHYGTFRVIELKHQCNDSGNYSNSFTAIPTDIDAYPLTNINTFNRAEVQVAKVFDNVDPEGISRIQVQFPWQLANNTTTPWIRVMTPHSGADKGFHFIPEITEEVLIGFEGGNADRPYVMGALYTGQNKPEEFQSDANNIKAIRTRSGHTIELNDTEGEEKINIYDNEGSIITFDTQAKSLTINATETIDIAAKNINITAEENISIQAQGNIETASEGDTAIQAQGAIDVQAAGDASLTSSGAVAVEATSDATVKGANAVISGQASAELSGAQAKVAGSAMTEVTGGVVKIN